MRKKNFFYFLLNYTCEMRKLALGLTSITLRLYMNFKNKQTLSYMHILTCHTLLIRHTHACILNAYLQDSCCNITGTMLNLKTILIYQINLSLWRIISQGRSTQMRVLLENIPVRLQDIKKNTSLSLKKEAEGRVETT